MAHLLKCASNEDLAQNHARSGVVVGACNPSTEEIEMGPTGQFSKTNQ